MARLHQARQQARAQTRCKQLCRTAQPARSRDLRDHEVMSSAEPYALNENGSAKDPKAFREALRGDALRMAALQVR